MYVRRQTLERPSIKSTQQHKRQGSLESVTHSLDLIAFIYIEAIPFAKGLLRTAQLRLGSPRPQEHSLVFVDLISFL